VVVDYLQLVRPADQRANKADQLELIAQGLHEIAQRNRCVVIALAQLNRSSGASEGVPGQGSFKGSGCIEAAADVFMGLYREKFYKIEAVEDSMEMLILKSRHGTTGVWSGAWEGQHQRVLARESWR
jgi:replicative DNA helicase